MDILVATKLYRVFLWSWWNTALHKPVFVDIETGLRGFR